MKRQDGYYWVRHPQYRWSAAHWNADKEEWSVTWSPWVYDDGDFSEIDETPIVRNTLLDRFTDRHTRIDEMIRNALGQSVCALIDSMSLDESKAWLTNNGYTLVQEPGRVVLMRNGVTIGEIRV